jgi:hypothetical protein
MTYPPQPTGAPVEKRRPGTVTFAVTLQVLLALGMIVSAITNYVYGPDADAAAQAELARQGLDVSDLPEGTDFSGGGGGTGMVVPIVIAVLILVLAILNFGGNRVGRILTWIFQPLVLICGGIVAALQVALEPFLQWTFDNSGDERVEALDAGRIVDAILSAYPGWSQVVDYAVLVLATVGSLLIIILLAVPASSAYFRKEPPQTYIPGAPPQ